MDFYRRSFAKAGALAYLGEAAAHVVVLTTSFRLSMLPFAADWFFLLLGGYSAAGLWALATQVKLRGCGWCVVYWITTLHLTISVLLHAYLIAVHSHERLTIFHQPYSILGLAYCLFFTWYLWTLPLPRRAE